MQSPAQRAANRRLKNRDSNVTIQSYIMRSRAKPIIKARAEHRVAFDSYDQRYFDLVFPDWNLHFIFSNLFRNSSFHAAEIIWLMLLLFVNLSSFSHFLFSVYSMFRTSSIFDSDLYSLRTVSWSLRDVLSMICEISASTISMFRHSLSPSEIHSFNQNLEDLA